MITSFEIRTLAKAGRREEAAAAAAQLLSEETGTLFSDVAINDDRYSLNSVNGTAVDAGGQRLFFKFHTEEGETETVGEYYKAHVLAEAGLPVDLPVKACSTPGRQFLLYAFRNDAKLADVCLSLERRSDPAPRRRPGLPPFSADEIVAAQADLDDLTLQAALTSLAPSTPESAGEALHQLFHHRLVTPGVSGLGGRYAQFYQGKRVPVAGQEVPWDAFADLRWTINGVAYRHTLRELFERSHRLLDPRRMAEQPVIVAHGDAHNANVWIRRNAAGRAELVLFDPAFAGKTIPALLGEVKATFHNTLAHPLWLYTPDLADTAFRASAEPKEGRIVLSHDWALSELRQHFLSLKRDRYWRPLLRRLQEMGALPDEWEAIVRSALFCCPTLVMSQMPGPERSPSISLLGFAVSVMCGSEPDDATAGDMVSALFADLRSALPLS